MATLDITARQSLSIARDKGIIARFLKNTMESNPYPRGTMERASWDGGWRTQDLKEQRETEAAGLAHSYPKKTLRGPRLRAILGSQ